MEARVDNKQWLAPGSPPADPSHPFKSRLGLASGKGKARAVTPNARASIGIIPKNWETQ